MSTSDPSGLLEGLHRQPVLAVLRPENLSQACLQLEQLSAVGLQHIELAASSSRHWVEMAQSLRRSFPALALGAASVRTTDALEASVAAGLTYVVSPILEPLLLERARVLEVTLVPGVFTPSEIARAVHLGAPAVKLFPAAALGPRYWNSLAAPMAPLPFCIAAGGLQASEAQAWFEAGVNAVALGGSLFDNTTEPGAVPRLRPGLPSLLRWLESRDNPGLLSD
ncbi:MAG: bifunctional 4-hydroxy-2-oxoglutarate aldolase/2-dehydro-3-deoxy-phosphogluconate aldolase [Vulcanococcus sp.]